MRLELREITKRFGSFTANDSISITVEPGQIHCLLGENGAGKSTLMNVLFGLLHPEEGEILIDGEVTTFADSGEAVRRGIGMVHQHFMLVPVFSVAEDEKTKVEVFKTLDAVVQDSNAILATNTSSIPIIKLAMATRRPEQVIGMHFFNPVPVLKLVEVISSLLTSAETTERVHEFASGPLKKRVITSPDRAGFVVNALLILSLIHI